MGLARGVMHRSCRMSLSATSVAAVFQFDATEMVQDTTKKMARTSNELGKNTVSVVFATFFGSIGL